MKEQRNKHFWDAFAGKYDAFIERFANKSYTNSLILIKNELTPDARVLEIGTGTGLISLEIAAMVKKVVAIDYSEGMIKEAKAKLERSAFTNIEFSINDASNIDIKDESFDIIIASNIFHLLPEPDRAMFEINRLLDKNGKVIIPTFCHGQNIKTRIISAIMSLSGFKAVNKWSALQFRAYVESHELYVEREEIIPDRIPLLFIVASK